MKYIDRLIFKLCYFIVLAGILIAGGGCSTPAPIIKTVTKIEYKPIAIAPLLLKPCKVTTPPDKEAYLEATFQKREEYLTNYTVELLSDLKICNSQINTIKESQEEQIKLYGNRQELKQ